MKIWPFTQISLVCAATLTSLILAANAHAGNSTSPSVLPDTFDLATYREMEKTDRRTLGLILTAMRETVFYAQKSVGKSVICASPRPIPVAELMERVDKEIAAPTNPAIHKYADNVQLAFIFVSAMKDAAYCD